MNVYVAGQIVVWMLLACLAGLVTGWLMKGRIPLVRAMKPDDAAEDIDSEEVLVDSTSSHRDGVHPAGREWRESVL